MKYDEIKKCFGYSEALFLFLYDEIFTVKTYL